MNEFFLRYIRQTREIYGNKLFYDYVLSEKINNNLNLLEFNDCKCTGCPLDRFNNNFLFGYDNQPIDIIFIGEILKENLIDSPFAGEGGNLLDKIFSSINISREDIYMYSISECSSSENNDVLKKGLEVCLPCLRYQISIIKPKLIVSLGQNPAIKILSVKEPFEELKNNIFKYEGFDFLVTYHPITLLQKPKYKRYAWDDFQFIRNNYIVN